MLRHLPNLITLLRIALVAPLFWLIVQHRYDAALTVTALAAVSDALDGFLARQFGWKSWLGGMLDPIADKLMLVVGFVALGMVGAIGWWLPALVIGRDIFIVAGASLYYGLIGRFNAAPTFLSKLTTLAQIVFLVAELLRLSTFAVLPDNWRNVLVVVVVALTIGSGVNYVVVWGLRAWRVARDRGRGES